MQFETSDTGHVLDILKQVSVERLETVRLHTVWLLALKIYTCIENSHYEPYSDMLL